MNSRIQTSISLGLAWFVLVPLLSTVSFAQNRAVPPKVSGYRVSVTDNWISCYQGYSPVRVTITDPAVATTEDEAFIVSIKGLHYSNGPYLVSAPIVIPTGAKSASVELYLQTDTLNDSYSTEIRIERGAPNGRLDPDDLLFADLNWDNGYSMQPSMLMVNSGYSDCATRSWICFRDNIIDAGRTNSSYSSADPLPSFDKLDAICELNPTNVRGIVRNKVPTPPSAVLDNNIRLSAIRPDQLPENWLGLTGIEQVLISIDDFKLICSQQEQNRSNLEKWLVAGGTLIVLETGPKFEEANQILPLLLGRDRSVMADRIDQAWKVPGAGGIRKLNKLIPTTVTPSYSYGNDTWYDGSEVELIKQEAGELDVLDDLGSGSSISNFAISSHLNGRIVAVSDDMSNWTESDWRVLLNSIAINGPSIQQRIGSSIGNEVHPDFRIPGVGEPPVRMFQVLISLFLLLAGPVMLIVLKKTGQMQLLFVAVPSLSLLVCISLLLYAVLSDGSKRWGRSQSVTTMDHRTNMAVTHARATYYTGSRPGPYVFREDTLAKTSYGRSNATLADRFGGGVHQLSGAEIRPRNPHEVVTVRSQPATQRLIFVPASNHTDAPAMQNRLGADVKLVVFRTADGLFSIADLKADQTATAQPVQNSQANSLVQATARNILTQNDTLTNAYRRWNMSDNHVWGDEVTVVNQLQNPDMDEFLDQPNTYIALLEAFPLAAEQLEPVQYKLQLHVVRGQW